MVQNETPEKLIVDSFRTPNEGKTGVREKTNPKSCLRVFIEVTGHLQNSLAQMNGVKYVEKN